MRSSALSRSSTMRRSASKRASHSAATVSALRAPIHRVTAGLAISSSQRYGSSASVEFTSLAMRYATLSSCYSRAPQQRPQLVEAWRLAQRLQRRENLPRPVLVNRLGGAVHEFRLDLRRRERKLERAAGVIAQALEPAAVGEAHDHARGTLLENIGKFRIDRDRHQARGGAHPRVGDRALGEG